MAKTLCVGQTICLLIIFVVLLAGSRPSDAILRELDDSEIVEQHRKDTVEEMAKIMSDSNEWPKPNDTASCRLKQIFDPNGKPSTFLDLPIEELEIGQANSSNSEAEFAGYLVYKQPTISGRIAYHLPLNLISVHFNESSRVLKIVTDCATITLGKFEVKAGFLFFTKKLIKVDLVVPHGEQRQVLAGDLSSNFGDQETYLLPNGRFVCPDSSILTHEYSCNTYVMKEYRKDVRLFVGVRPFGYLNIKKLNFVVKDQEYDGCGNKQDHCFAN